MAKDKPGYILTKDTAKMAKLAKQWLKLSPTKRSEFREKNKLQSLISKARGSIIFGAINDAERSTNNIVAGLDEKGALIFVFGKPAKVYDPASFMNKVVKKEDFEANEDDFELQEAFKSPSRVDKARKVGVATGYDNNGDVGPYEVWIEPNKKYGGDSIYFKPKKGSETPRWGLNDILYGNKAFSTKPIADSLLIDYGQGWGVKGLDPILKKLRKEFAPTNEEVADMMLLDEFDEGFLAAAKLVAGSAKLMAKISSRLKKLDKDVKSADGNEAIASVVVSAANEISAMVNKANVDPELEQSISNVVSKKIKEHLDDMPISILRKYLSQVKEDFDLEDLEHDTSELIGHNLQDRRLHAKIRACVESSVTDDQLDHLIEDFGLNEHSSNRDIIVASTALPA